MEFARLLSAIVSIGAGLAVVLFLDRGLSPDQPEARSLLIGEDLLTLRFAFPTTVQAVMWVVFFFGLGELIVRTLHASRENAEIGKGFLDEDPDLILDAEELSSIFRRIQGQDRRLYLPQMLGRCVNQLLSSGQLDHASALMNSSLELLQHETELRYNIMRYITWLIPTLGFIGTVIGISQALSFAGAEFGRSGSDIPLDEVTNLLGVAFYTTLLALLMSALLILVFYVVQAYEERALNRCGQYCLDHLLNKVDPDLSEQIRG